MRFFSILCVFFLVFAAGCSREGKPEVLKDLNPVTVTVVDGGAPVEGVRVLLSSKGPRGAWGCSATTNAQGEAKIQTSISSKSGPGAPAGDYIIVLSKNVPLPPELEPQEEDQNLSASAAAAKEAKKKEFYDKNRIIPQKLEQSDTSPLELTVAEKTGGTLKVDLAEHK